MTLEVVEGFKVVVGLRAGPRPGARTILEVDVETETVLELDDDTVELETTRLLGDTIDCELVVVPAEAALLVVLTLLIGGPEVVTVAFEVVVAA